MHARVDQTPHKITKLVEINVQTEQVEQHLLNCNTNITNI